MILDSVMYDVAKVMIAVDRCSKDMQIRIMIQRMGIVWDKYLIAIAKNVVTINRLSVGL